MWRIVVREGSDAGVRDQYTKGGDPHRGWNYQWHGRGHGHGALRRTRGHRTVRAAGITVAAVSEGLAVTCMGDGIANAARSQGRCIDERRSLQDGG
jgi:hypothetical protein